MSEYESIDRAKAAFARAGIAWPSPAEVQIEMRLRALKRASVSVQDAAEAFSALGNAVAAASVKIEKAWGSVEL